MKITTEQYLAAKDHLIELLNMNRITALEYWKEITRQLALL